MTPLRTDDGAAAAHKVTLTSPGELMMGQQRHKAILSSPGELIMRQQQHKAILSSPGELMMRQQQHKMTLTSPVREQAVRYGACHLAAATRRKLIMFGLRSRLTTVVK